MLIADNEEVFREGLAKLLDEQPNISVVFQGAPGEEALKAAKEQRPDVVLVNGATSQREIIETVSAMAREAPSARVAVIAHPEAGTGALNVLKAGARACLAKSISAADLVRSIELISSGRVIISPLFAEEFLGEVVTADRVDESQRSDAAGVLSPREMEIVKFIAEGNTNKEIAVSLYIAETTVKAHVKNALRKLELRNRQQLVAYAVLQGWITTDKDSAEGPK